MNTKPITQIIAEGIQATQNFANNLEALDNQYDIKDNIFLCGRNGNIEEAEVGYFGQNAVYETLNEAIKNFNPYIQGIRIYEGKYAVGTVYLKLSDVKEDVVIDIQERKVL